MEIKLYTIRALRHYYGSSSEKTYYFATKEERDKAYDNVYKEHTGRSSYKYHQDFIRKELSDEAFSVRYSFNPYTFLSYYYEKGERTLTVNDCEINILEDQDNRSSEEFSKFVDSINEINERD